LGTVAAAFLKYPTLAYPNITATIIVNNHLLFPDKLAAVPNSSNLATFKVRGIAPAF